MIATAFGIVFGLFGMGLFFYSLLQLVRAYMSSRWPEIDAEVIQKYVNETRGRRTQYEPVVRYRYFRNGREHEGEQILFVGVSLTTTSRDEAERFLGQFQRGVPISIRVSPANDSLSVIEPGVDYRWSWVGFAWSLLFMALGFSLIG